MNSEDSKKEPLSAQVSKWLEQQGYPLEMRVASALRKQKFWVRQSAHYVDQESGKSREIDVIAMHVEPIGVAETYFVVECKASNKPWVLFTSEHRLNNFNRMFALGIFSQRATEYFSGRFDEATKVLKWLQKDGRIGYNLTSAFTSGEDSAFGAASTVVKACLSLLKASKKSVAGILTYTFPAIVIGAPLFESYLDENGEIKVREIEQGWLFFNARIESFRGTCIRVVSQSALEKYAAEVSETNEKLQKLIEPDVHREWQQFQKDMERKR